MSLSESRPEPTIGARSLHVDGEQLPGVEPDTIRHSWRDDLRRLVHLAPKDHDIAFEGHNKDGERFIEVFPVVEDEDAPGHKRVIITTAAAVTMAGIGYSLYKKGLLGPKSRKV